MLWTKEDTANNSFVDIFTSLNAGRSPSEPTAVRSQADDADFKKRSKHFDHKFEQYAEECRDEGKSWFGKKNYLRAMREFNRSLMFARPGSLEIGFGLANRSACFFYLNMPDECLHDIELAKASNYPSHLRPKLDDRALKCQTLKSQNVRPNHCVIREPTLGFWEHDLYAGVADCLEIQRNDEFGYHIRTICDLDIGQTVLVEQPFSVVPTKFSVQHRDRCFYCFQQLKNFITCTDCLKGFYCTVECMERAHHRIDCSMDVIEDDKDRHEIELVVKTFLHINAAFPDANSLMKVVDLLLQDNDFESDDLTPVQRNFCMLFQITKCNASNLFGRTTNRIEKKVSSCLSKHCFIPEHRAKVFDDRPKVLLATFNLSFIWNCRACN